jgi:hydroxymethylpyrimidine pyrophosphatase-like HAD family hydrolase
MNRYIFDVDGTLTDSVNGMHPRFMRFFEGWIKYNSTYLCTNNDYSTIKAKLGRRIVENCSGVFCCAANSVYFKGKMIRKQDYNFNIDLIPFLENKINSTTFRMKAGPQITIREGIISFSILGKTELLRERNMFKSWDRENQERLKIIKEINNKFPELHATLAGDTSIDITAKSKDKSQVFTYFSNEDTIHYIGNELHNHGNDSTILEYSKSHGNIKVFPVKKWKDTYDFCEKITIQNRAKKARKGTSAHH